MEQVKRSTRLKAQQLARGGKPGKGFGKWKTDRWYAATLVFVSKEPGQSEAPWTMEEQIRLIRAASNEIAYQKAQQLGKKIARQETEETANDPIAGGPFILEFIGLKALSLVRDEVIRDGTEVMRDIYEIDTTPEEYAAKKEHLDVFVQEEVLEKLGEFLLEQRAGGVAAEEERL